MELGKHPECTQLSACAHNPFNIASRDTQIIAVSNCCSELWISWETLKWIFSIQATPRADLLEKCAGAGWELNLWLLKNVSAAPSAMGEAYEQGLSSKDNLVLHKEKKLLEAVFGWSEKHLGWFKDYREMGSESQSSSAGPLGSMPGLRHVRELGGNEVRACTTPDCRWRIIFLNAS